MMTNNSIELHTDSIETDSTVITIVFVLYCLVSVVGICGNALTILSILLNKKLKSIPNVYIGNLATADFIVCSVIAPFSAYVLIADKMSLKSHICTFIGALNVALLGNTMFNLAAIAVNRYILLVRGSRLYRKLYTRRNVILSVITLWVMPVIMVLPALSGFGSFGYNRLMGTCIFISHDKITYIYVQSILHGICVGPSIGITVFCYVRIIIHFRRTQNRLKMSVNKKMQTPVVNSKVNSTTLEYRADDSSKVEEYEISSSGPSNNNSVQTPAAKRTRASRRVVANLCTVFVVFICCWSPVVTIFTVDYYRVFPAAVYQIFLVIAVANSCLNVFIYAGMNRVFRKTYIRLLRCRLNKINSSF